MKKGVNHPEWNRVVEGSNERRCRTCKHWCPLTDFVNYRSYYGYLCKPCHNMSQRARRARIAGDPDALTYTLREQLNRVIDGIAERCCRKCEKWKLLDAFPVRQGNRKYRCLECEHEYNRVQKRGLRHRPRSQSKPDRRRYITGPRESQERKPFDTADIKGLLRFASMPTPTQLLAKSAA